MCGNTNQKIGSENLPDDSRRYRLCSEMNTVGAPGACNVGPVVNEQKGWPRINGMATLDYQIKEDARAHRLLAQLYKRDPGLCRCLNKTYN
jgi:hypothetical protein